MSNLRNRLANLENKIASNEDKYKEKLEKIKELWGHASNSIGDLRQECIQNIDLLNNFSESDFNSVAEKLQKISLEFDQIFDLLK